MKAHCLIRQDPVYRRDAFMQGLKAAGYDVDTSGVASSWRTARGDVLVIWNRYQHYHDMANQFEAAGGTVLVAENGYLGNDRNNRTRYAIAVGGHNGSGSWPIGGGERWEALGIKLQPWREQGTHILVCPNRSFGRPDIIMPNTWPEATMQRIARVTKRPVRLRPHPGNGAPKIPLVNDLRDAWAVVVWTSSAGCEALVHGIPVYAMGPYWIASSVASKDLTTIDNPPLPDRLPAMQKLAWAQWHIDEIARGEPFQHIHDTTSSLTGSV